MGMVMEKITVNRSKLKKWDDNSDGRISYEELKRGVDGSVAPKTLKQVFKRADLDRDLYLSKDEYLTLRGGLERGRVDTAPLRPKRSDDMKNSDYEEKTLQHARSSRSILSEDWDYPGEVGHRIVPRDAAETAPPPVEVGHVKISDSGEIDKEFAALISARTMLGGGRPPAELEVATVKYDDPDFQRWRSI